MEDPAVLTTKKKTHRRKAGGKKKKDRSVVDTSDDPSSQQNSGEPPRKQVKISLKERRPPVLHRPPTRRLLRPATVPKAPQNSTSFIIDDHENSRYFLDFERGFTVTSSPGNSREGVGWSPYFQQDFENVYRTARESEAIDWTHEVLVDKISSLEERVKTLEQQLALCDPNSVFMTQMQHRIVCMQDENRRIKEFRVWCPMHGKKVRLHESTSGSSSDDCSSSSSQSNDEEDVVQNGTESDSSGDNEDDQDQTQDRAVSVATNTEQDLSTERVSSRLKEDDSSEGESRTAVQEETVTGETRGSERSVQSNEEIMSSEGL